MTEHDHQHDHEHDHEHEAEHGHHHGHGHDSGPAAAPSAVEVSLSRDAASASLARALRMSFLFLTVIIIGVTIGFLFSGMTTVNSDERGVVTVFGRVVEVVGPGLHWTWPYPVGDIRKVSTAKKTLMVNFWPWLSAEDELKAAKGDYSKIMWMEKGLRPGVDGALLTGDEYLFHAKLQCMFEVEDPSVYLSGMLEPNVAVETAVASAAIRAAARRTAEGLTLGAEQGIFLTQIEKDAQEILKKLGAGVRVTRVTLVDWKWPFRALPDFQAAQTAGQLRSKAVEGAIGEAKHIVGTAVGDASARKLVGEPWREAELKQGAPAPGEDYDLIGQYELARADANVSLADREALLARIDNVLLSQGTQGDVTSILRDATAFYNAQKAAVDARAALLDKVLAEYKKSPEFFLQRMWTETREVILQSPTVVKWFINPAQGKTVILINTPPEILKEMDREWLKASPPPR